MSLISYIVPLDRTYCPGKFFDMPRGVKPAQPQQSSLEESWRVKQKGDASESKAEASSPSIALEGVVDEAGARQFPRNERRD